MSSDDLGKSRHGIPDVVMVHIDKYVDSLAPQIQPRIASELEVFQKRTIDSLEGHVISAFRSLFNKDTPSGTRSLDANAPDSYGAQSLPFANELASLTRGFSKIADEAGGDIRDIFDLTEQGPQQQSRGNPGEAQHHSSGARGFLTAALGVVQEQLDKESRGQGSNVPLDGLLGVLSQTVKEAARNPEEKARAIVPEIRDKVASRLQEQHASIAEQFTRIALDKIKRWLRGNTSAREVGEGVTSDVKDEIKGLVKGMKGLFGGRDEKGNGGDGPQARGLGEGTNRAAEGEGGGISKLVSDKLSTGLARVHREVRLEFRTILGAIEKQLFELLPEEVQGPLEKILGGNPFDAELDRSAASQSVSRGLGDEIKVKLVDKIRKLVRKVQEMLRESILSVVNGGHRKLERESWVFVQNIVELKVQKYLPSVRINVPDDIGNEGVSVGTVKGSQIGGGPPAATTDYARADQPGSTYSQTPSQERTEGYDRPQSYNQPQSYGQAHEYYQQPTNTQPTYNQQPPHNPQQSYDQRQSSDTSQGYNQPQSYDQPQSYNKPQSYEQSQGYNSSQSYEASQGYNKPQSYGQPPTYSQNQSYDQPQSYNQPQSHGQHQSYGQQPPDTQQSSYNQQTSYNSQQSYEQHQGHGQHQSYNQYQQYQ